MSSWSGRLYHSLTLSLPRPQLAGRRYQSRRLLRRILRNPQSFGFEAPHLLHSRQQSAGGGRLLPLGSQAVMVAWAGADGHLSPVGLRAALVANFVLLINRAFGHTAHAVASVLPTGEKEEACRHRRMLGDIGLLGLQSCRLESENCYARETHRLASVLRGLALPGSESWCDRRLRDLLAALARAERSGCERMHWVAGAVEAGRLSELESALRALGYPQLAAPAPWSLHVKVGPVALPAQPGGARRKLRANPRPEDLLRLTGSREALLLQLLSAPRCRPARLLPPTSSGVASPVVVVRSGSSGHTALALRRCRSRLAARSVHLAEALSSGGSLVDDLDDNSGSSSSCSNGFWDVAADRPEDQLARHLATFPLAASAAYLTYEPRHLVAFLADLLPLMEAALQLLDESDRFVVGKEVWGRRRRRQDLAMSVTAGAHVMESACGVLGLGPSAAPAAGDSRLAKLRRIY